MLTYKTMESFKEELDKGDISFPVFKEPNSGSGSVRIGKVDNWEEVETRWNDRKFIHIIQRSKTL